MGIDANSDKRIGPDLSGLAVRSGLLICSFDAEQIGVERLTAPVTFDLHTGS